MVLWRRTNTYCDVTLADSPQNASKWCHRRRQFDYHSIIIESDSRRFHWLTSKTIDQSMQSFIVAPTVLIVAVVIIIDDNTISICMIHSLSTNHPNTKEEYISLIARFMGPTWGSPGADRTQLGPMWATWTLLSGRNRNWKIPHQVWYQAVCDYATQISLSNLKQSHLDSDSTAGWLSLDNEWYLTI